MFACAVIVNPFDDGIFTINARTGVVSLTSGLDYETSPEHELVITATEKLSNGEDGKSSSTTLIVTVEDQAEPEGLTFLGELTGVITDESPLPVNDGLSASGCFN